MIIKSMARKEASFKSLIEYMNKDCSKNTLKTSRNLLSENKEDIILEFEKNSKYLKKRKNGNYLYHEVITIPKQEKVSLKKQQQILIDLADNYLEKRAEKLLSYGVIHTDTQNLHIHLIISANELLSNKRYRLTKKKFNEIQKELEEYKLEKYPELKTQKIYTKDIKQEKTKSISKREYEVIKRGGTSKRKEIADITREIIRRSKNEQDLINSLVKINFKIYTRGKNIGLENIDTKRRYRFKTLGIEEDYKEFKKQQERLNELSQEKQVKKSIDRVIKLNKEQQERLNDINQSKNK